MSTILGSMSARARLVALSTLALVLLAPFASTLLFPRGQIFGDAHLGDNPSYYFFANDFAARALRAGELPLWNPYAMLGFPHLAEGQTATFHPLSWLYLPLPTEIAINWFIALSVLFSGLAFWSFLRALGLGHAAAWCGALVWAFAGRVPGRIDAGHLNMLVGFVSWPLVVGAWERYRTTGRLGHMGVLALAYGALVLAGYPQFTFIFSLFFLCYVSLQCIVTASSRGIAWKDVRAILVLGLFVLLGVGISAAQLLPTYDFVNRSARAESTYEFSTILSLPPEALLTTLTPTFFGHTTAGPDQYWGRSIYWEMCLYVGILPLVAAVVGAVAAPREKRVALLGCALMFLVVAFGKYTPIYGLVYEFVPLASYFRGPGKYSAVTFFCAATLAGYGFQAMFDGFKQPLPFTTGAANARQSLVQPGWLRAAAIAIASLTWVVIGLMIWIYPTYNKLDASWANFLRWVQAQNESYLPPIEVNDHVLSLTGHAALAGLGWALLLLLGSTLLVYASWRPSWRRFAIPLAAVLLIADLGWSFNTVLSRFDAGLVRLPASFADVFARYSYPARVHDLSTGILLGGDGEFCRTYRNQGMSHGYTNISGYTGLMLRRYGDLFNGNFTSSSHGLGSNTSDQLRRVYRMLAVDYLIALESNVTPGTQAVARHVGRALIPLNPYYGRVRLLRDVITTDDPEEACAYVRNFNERPSAQPILETTSIMPDPAPLRPNEFARITKYENNRVEIDALTAQPRVLLLAEMYDKNWRVTVNGESRPVMAANYLLRAVRLPAGVSKVVFEYVDPQFQLGWKISLASLALTLTIVMISLWRCRPYPDVPLEVAAPSTGAVRERSPKSPKGELATAGVIETSLWRRWGFRAMRKP